MQLESTITCPHCGASSAETMPTDACLWLFECPGCQRLLRPLPGDCCVFCSYGTAKCPPRQLEGCSCRTEQDLATSSGAKLIDAGLDSSHLTAS